MSTERMQLGGKEVRVLQAAHLLDSPTRNEIARFTGLSAVTVTSLLDRLLHAGLIARMGKTSSGSGRPSTLYRVNPDFGYCVGISVEMSSFHLVAIDSGTSVIEEREHALSLSSGSECLLDEIVQPVLSELERLRTTDRLAGHRLLALGVALPGMVDTERGVWLHGLQVSGIAHVNLRQILEEKVSVPVVVEDQSRCLTWRETARSGGRSTEPLVFLYLGSGVGTGIVIDQRLYRGFSGLAGEIGHLPVAEQADRCPCGNIGCLEMVVSVPSILRRFRRQLSEGVISSLQRYGPDRLTVERILEAAKMDDRLARSILYEVGLFLGDACALLVELYNPRSLVVGGPGSALYEFFRDAVDLRIRQRVIPEMLADLQIRSAPHRPPDEATGAAMIAERRFWKHLDTATTHRLGAEDHPRRSSEIRTS